MPGTLPAINRRAVEFAMRVALALDCEVSEKSIFARKNYFYPDLPKGYQISQYENPLAQNGCLNIYTDQGKKPIRIRRVHLEEDTGKLFHQADHSLVDYNRSGVPLLEIVTEPDMSSVEEVKAFATQLRSLLRYLKVNSGDMEKGVIRFEANVSVRPKGTNELYTRTEIKNLNSFRSMVKAVSYEVDRQSQLLDQGKSVKQETLGWDENANQTVSQRSKEEAHDYRYFPEPDLPQLYVSTQWVNEIRSSIPELPHQKRERYLAEFGLTNYAASIIADEKSVASFFEASVLEQPDLLPKKLSNWISTDLFSLLNETTTSIEESQLNAQSFARLVSLVEKGEISAASGKVLLSELFNHGGDPEHLIEERGLRIIQDSDQLNPLIDKIIEQNPDQVKEYLSGKTAILQWLLGQVMKATGGRADPEDTKRLLNDKLDSLSGEV
jgi:aspartyl-tRNA(Asn)/glutamyl-tRNA(Gln) amidotransferase subunit B